MSKNLFTKIIENSEISKCYGLDELSKEHRNEILDKMESNFQKIKYETEINYTMKNPVRESLDSRRLKVINSQINDIQDEVADLSDALVDREKQLSVQCIEDIRSKLNMLKEQLVNGNIV